MSIPNFIRPSVEELKESGGNRVLSRNFPVNLSRVNFIMKAHHVDAATNEKFPAITFAGIQHKWAYATVEERDSQFLSIQNVLNSVTV